MITSIKKFGSYELNQISPFAQFISDDSFEGSTHSVSSENNCTIPSNWTELKLLKISPYNHDTSIFRFMLPYGIKNLFLPVGGFLLVLAPKCEHDGGDAVRPYTNISDECCMNNEIGESSTGYFEILCKRYDQWGIKESIQTHFLFTKTNHSYKPPGAVSNYIHKLKIGDSLKFKYVDSVCRGKINYPFCENIVTITMIAVGVGVAPMIQILRAIFRDIENGISNIKKIVLLYGVRNVNDILMRDILDDWNNNYNNYFKVVYCVGSRWNNIHMGILSKNGSEYVPPPLPEGFSKLRNAELGWVNEEKIQKYSEAPSDGIKILVCGLPGVYEKLCGPRDNNNISRYSILFKLGFTDNMVIKL